MSNTKNQTKDQTISIVFGIPNCDQIKKTRVWLTAHAVPYEFHDVKKSPLQRAVIESWLKTVPWEVLVNRKGTTWRGLSEAGKAAVTDADSAIELMLASPSVIKRPVLLMTDANGAPHCTVGFSEESYQQLFPT
ncbi:MAG: arsenate reductase [Pseudomonadota bacterium]